MRQSVNTLWNQWRASETGAAIVEFAFLFPVLIALVLGSYDIGKALIINQKIISASQIMADLITRQDDLLEDDLEDIILAGQMAIDPYDRTPMGYDIVSVEYDDDDEPTELWRVTDNMAENEDALEGSEGLGLEGEGIVVVTVSYTYEPYFTNFITENVSMQETAFLRGRRTSLVECDDC